MADYKISILVEGEDRASGPLRGVGGALGSLGTIAGGILTAGAIQQIGQGIAGMAKDAFEATKNMENSRISLASMITQELKATNNPFRMANANIEELTANVMDWVKKLAIESPFSRQGVEDALKMAKAYGFTTEESKRLTAATIDYTAATGRSSFEMERIARALGQIKAKGKLAGGEVLQLTEAGVAVHQILSKAFGKTTEEIVKMQEDGLLPAQKVIDAIIKSMETDYGGSAKKFTNTFSGMISSIQDLKEFRLIDLFEPSFKVVQPYLENFVNMLQDPAFVEKVQAAGNKIGGYVQGAIDFTIGLPDKINGLLTAIQTAWDATDKGPLNITSKGIVDALLDWSETSGPKIAESFQQMMAEVTIWANDPNTIAQAREAGRQIGLNIAWLGVGDPETSTRIGGSVLGFLGEIGKAIMGAMDIHVSFGKAIAEGIAQGVQEVVTSQWGAMWGEAFNKGTRDALILMNPLMWSSELSRIGRDIGTAIWNAAQATLDGLGALFVSVVGRWAGFEGGGPAWSPKLNDDPGTTTPGWRDVGAGGARASGGSILPNRAYWVGEQGPELLFTGATSGYVMNNRQSMAMAGAGGGININLYVDQMASDIDVESLAQRLVRVIKQNQGI